MWSLVFVMWFILPLRFSFLSDLDFLSDQMCQKLMWDVLAVFFTNWLGLSCPLRSGFPLRPDVSKADVGHVGCFLPLPTFFHPLDLLSSQIRTSSQTRSFKSRFEMFWQFFASIKDFSSIGSQYFPLRLLPGCWCDMLNVRFLCLPTGSSHWILQCIFCDFLMYC